MQRAGGDRIHPRVPGRSGSRQHAVIIFTRTPQIRRTSPDEPYAALPWEDVDALFTAILVDVIDHSCQAGDVDVLLYRNPVEFSDDFLHPFRNRVQCIDMQDGPIADLVPGAIEQAIASHYSRVIVILENHPLIGPDLLAKVFAQLGCEDDCIVFGPTLEGPAYLVGVKSNHPRLFDTDENNPPIGPEAFLRSACRENALVFAAPARYALDSGSHLARARSEIEAMLESETGFPSRTSAMFQSFDRKYKSRKSNR